MKIITCKKAVSYLKYEEFDADEIKVFDDKTILSGHFQTLQSERVDITIGKLHTWFGQVGGQLVGNKVLDLDEETVEVD